MNSVELSEVLSRVNQIRIKYILKQIISLILALLLVYLFFTGLLGKYYFDPVSKIVNKINISFICVALTIIVSFLPFVLFFYLLRNVFGVRNEFRSMVGLYFINQLLEKKGAVLELGRYEITSDVWDLFIDYYDDYDIDHIVKSKKFIMQYMKFTKTEETRDEDGNVSTTTKEIFSGYIVMYFLEKNYNINLVIKNNSFHLSDILPIGYDESRIKLDSPDFEKKFDVYGNDQINARVYLNHKRMQELLDVKLDKRLIINNNLAYYAFSSEKIYLTSIPFYSDVKVEDIYHLVDIYNYVEYIWEKIK